MDLRITTAPDGTSTLEMEGVDDVTDVIALGQIGPLGILQTPPPPPKQNTLQQLAEYKAQIIQLAAQSPQYAHLLETGYNSNQRALPPAPGPITVRDLSREPVKRADVYDSYGHTYYPPSAPTYRNPAPPAPAPSRMNEGLLYDPMTGEPTFLQTPELTRIQTAIRGTPGLPASKKDLQRMDTVRYEYEIRNRLKTGNIFQKGIALYDLIILKNPLVFGLIIGVVIIGLLLAYKSWSSRAANQVVQPATPSPAAPAPASPPAVAPAPATPPPSGQKYPPIPGGGGGGGGADIPNEPPPPPGR